jgi:hypothetical protein
MKTILSITALFFTLLSVAQTNPTTKLRGDNSFGIAVEIGGGLDYAKDRNQEVSPIQNPLTDRTELKNHPSIGLTCFFEHQFNFKRNNGLILGVGLNTTFFSPHILYENPEPVSSIYFNGQLVLGTNTKQYDLERSKMSYFSIEFPILYTKTFNTKKNWDFSPYAGVKFRNAVYVSGESRNPETNNGQSTFEGSYGVDTTYYMHTNLKGGMQNSRIIVLPTIGLKVSKILPNGGKLNIFADYSYGLFNKVEAYYSNFQSAEKVETADGNGNTTYEMNYFQENRTLLLALNMSHIRVGLSYTLPNK